MKHELSAIETQYLKAHATSDKLFQRARQLIPGGITHDIRYLTPFPLYIERARGTRKWAVDGQELVDYWMGHGALFLGHLHPEVVRDELAGLGVQVDDQPGHAENGLGPGHAAGLGVDKGCCHLVVGPVGPDRDSQGHELVHGGDENRLRLVGAGHAVLRSMARRCGYLTRASLATAIVSASPCVMCAKLIINSGVTHVFYRKAYRDPSGVEVLQQGGVVPVLYDRWMSAWRNGAS